MNYVSVVAGVAISEGKVLVARRASNKSLAGFWEFPGGKVKSGESDHAALIREFREEFGIEIEPGELICESSSMPDQIILFSYLISMKELPTTSNSHDEIRWVSQSELLKLKVCPADIEVVNTVAPLIKAKNNNL